MLTNVCFLHLIRATNGSLPSLRIGICDQARCYKIVFIDESLSSSTTTEPDLEQFFMIVYKTTSGNTETMADIQPLVLHAHSTGPNPFKIAIALEYLRVPYEVKLWELGNNPQNGVKSAKFLAINENGRVPALEDPNTGVVSWESGAIMNYVRRVYDKDSNVLGPKEKGEQALVDFEKWEYFLLSTLGPMGGQTNWYRYVQRAQLWSAIAGLTDMNQTL